MRLIDADALADKLGIKYDCAHCEYECGPICTKGSEFVNACEAIFAAPIVDAVPVVRCKDCKEYIPWAGGYICGRVGSYYGNTKPDDFCSFGERNEASLCDNCDQRNDKGCCVCKYIKERSEDAET